MFNYACATTNFRVDRVLGGLSRPDSDSYKTLFCGKSFFVIISNRTRSRWPQKSVNPQNCATERAHLCLWRNSYYQKRRQAANSSHLNEQTGWRRFEGKYFYLGIAIKRAKQSHAKCARIQPLLPQDWVWNKPLQYCWKFAVEDIGK